MTRKLSLKNRRRIELGIILFITLLSFLLWDSFVIYPIKLFVVLFHEISHGIAAVVSGGKIIGIEVNYALGGKCIITGGSDILIASTGYIGSLIFGTLLFLSAYDHKNNLILTTILAGILIIFTANYIRGTEGILFTLTVAVILLLSPRILNKTINSYLMKILGLISCFYAIIDIKEDLLTLTYRLTDAQILADITGIPAIIWGLSWFLISLAVVYFIIRYSYKKGL